MNFNRIQRYEPIISPWNVSPAIMATHQLIRRYTYRRARSLVKKPERAHTQQRRDEISIKNSSVDPFNRKTNEFGPKWSECNKSNTRCDGATLLLHAIQWRWFVASDKNCFFSLMGRALARGKRKIRNFLLECTINMSIIVSITLHTLADGRRPTDIMHKWKFEDAKKSKQHKQATR